MNISSSAIDRQRGVAVVTALLLTTLAVAIVADLFWRQHVQIRSIENQYLHLQQKWILRSELDWAHVILSEDAGNSAVDHVGETWAVPLAVARLDEFRGNGSADGDTGNAHLSGSIIDAQSRYNLRNLAFDGVVNAGEVAVFRRLLTLLNLNSAWAQVIADAFAAAQQEARSGSPASASDIPGPDSPPMAIEHVEDLLAIPGLTSEMFDKLKDFVIVLPNPTPINANTAPAEVLAAKNAVLSLEDAAALVASRSHIYLRDGGDLSMRSSGKLTPESANEMSYATNFFIIHRQIRLNRASLEVQALMERNPMIGARTIWVREN